ncbi:MAG: hypothetical protein A2284_12285 [Deltaproteobacteria bacterium RIFOXYA12_FULL_61_11]|nr:MAG: hypothetical protein A2284_12285 [Deltaproteobacteria bacterium RIFOXYA12_FULL_61_11]
MIALGLYVLVTLSVSFLCSLLEAGLLSLPRPHLELMVSRGSKAGALLRAMKQDIERPLAAILTLNTVANTIGAAVVGAKTHELFGNHWVALASAGLTLCILVVSEIIPKTLGAAHCKKLAPFTAYTVRALVVVTNPLVSTVVALARRLSKRSHTDLTFSREEVAAVAEAGASEGTLAKGESKIIKNLLVLDSIQAREVLTPRSVLQYFQKDETVADLLQKHRSVRFSRIPVIGKDLDDVQGLVHWHQVFEAYSSGQGDLKVGDLAHPIHVVPDSLSVRRILDEFLRRREHLFLVVDEYGGTAGIVTFEDAIETLLGVEIIDEFDPVEDMRKYAVEEGRRKRRRREADSPTGSSEGEGFDGYQYIED